jgi:hypothetical protein
MDIGNKMYTEEQIRSIQTKPGFAGNGKPFDHVVKDKVAKGECGLAAAGSQLYPHNSRT